MNVYDEKHQMFAKVFSLINDMYPQKVTDIKNETIFPVDERMKFMFKSILAQNLELESYSFIYEPEEILRTASENQRRRLRRKARQESRANFVFVQTEKPSLIFANREICLTEQLAELLTMLYFRSKGYIVQRPLKTYNGVDDVVAWKSPLIEKLRAHRFIEYGCFADELGLLRRFGRVGQAKNEETHCEFILVEAESSIRGAMANDGGMNQLLGREWCDSNPSTYQQGAKQMQVASKLFVTFPVWLPTWFPEVDSFEKVVYEFDKRQPYQKVGIICWEPSAYHFRDSDQFQHDKMNDELSEYENHAKQLLLKNFYFDELLSLMRKLRVEFKGKTRDEVFRELDKKVQEADVDILISELDELLP